jgi:hemerythrin superfamily protein
MSDDQPAIDVLTLLHEQHLEVDGLFAELERLQPQAQGGGPELLDERRRLAEQVIAKLMQHANIEEEHFYPALRAATGDDALVSEALDQHRAAERDASAVDGISPDNLDFDPRLRALIADVREHVRVEETEIFPRIESALSLAQRQELGATLLAAMKHAPTHPHPHSPSPSTGVGKVMARGAAVADKMRDAAMGREKD